MSTIDDLIEKLEKAEAGSRELDAEIAATLRIPPPDAPNWITNWGGPYVAHTPLGRVAVQHSDGTTGVHWAAACYTTSIDAAKTLVLPNCKWVVGSEGAAAVYWETAPSYWTSWVEASASDPALALCIAAMKARKEP